MAHISIFEFDAVTASSRSSESGSGLVAVPAFVFEWLELECLRLSERGDQAWLRPVLRNGARAIQVTSHVGVIRVPGGFQIEVLPKIGKAIENGVVGARRRLIEMLCCLPRFRHIRTDHAALKAARMPLLEIFVSEFLDAVEHVVKRGLRGDYSQRSGNLSSLRGKLSIASHIRQNLTRRDRFFVDYDEFSPDRAENRLLHSALLKILVLTSMQEHQKRARELGFVFSDIPISSRPRLDFTQVRCDRGMEHYEPALEWSRLVLDEESPLTGTGEHHAPSLLFPMEALFESFVAKHLRKKVRSPLVLKPQTRAEHLVHHGGKRWFTLKPDLLVVDGQQNQMVIDTKWKLLDSDKANGSEKYGLSESDFYQLFAYGASYLSGTGEMLLVYPKTSTFNKPLGVFQFATKPGLRLWVVPFCLVTKSLVFEDATEFQGIYDALIAA